MSHNFDTQFVRNFSECQPKLYAYVLSLVCDVERAKDVLQETNVAIWENASRFTSGTNFLAWACRIAYYQVLAERQRRHRDRHLFDDQMLQEIASVAQSRILSLDDRSVALEECLQKLPARQRGRILQRYKPGGSVKAIAEDTGEAPGTIATALCRIRASLLNCIQRRLSRRAVHDS